MKRARRNGRNGNERRVARAYLRAAIGRIVRRFRPDKIILFGSHAGGRPHAGSDVDLLVIARSKEHPFERESKVDALLADRLVPMDILVRTPDELAAYRRCADPFWESVLDHGKVVYAARR